MNVKRLVAVCDILGFRHLVLSQNLEDLLHGPLADFRRIVSFSVKHGGVPELPPPLQAIREQDRVGFAWFSDTVVIYAKDDDDLSCMNVLETVGRLLFATMWGFTRIRAGVAYGEFYADAANEIFVGPALVEAYEMEQAQAWAGGALTESAAARLPGRTTTGERFQWWVCKYPVPLKVGAQVKCSNLAVDWTQGSHRAFKLLWSPSHAEPTEEERTSNPSRYDKWMNTRQFHEVVCVTCHPSNRERDPLKAM